VSDDEVRLGVLASLTTPSGPGFTGFDVGFEARLERANDEGGVAGRDLTVAEVYDDAGDVARNLDSARAAVQTDNLFALGVVSSAFQPQSSDLLSESEMPFIGAGYMPGFCGNDWGFGWNGCLLSDDFANGANVMPIIEGLDLDPEGLRWAVLTVDNTSGQAVVDAVTTVVEETGGTVVFGKASVPASGVVSDVNPFVRQILAAEPDVTILNPLLGTSVQLAAGLKAGDYEGAIVTYSGYVPGLLDASADTASALDGTYVVNQFPPQEDDSPAIRQIQEDLRNIGEEDQITLGVGYGYWSADILVQMFEAVGENLTAERFNEVVNAGFTYEPALEGGIQRAEFPAFHDEPAPCADLIAIEDGTYRPLIPLTCYESIPR